MSLPPAAAPSVPEATATVAHAVFPDGHPYLEFRDTCGPVFADADFADLFAPRGRLAEAPGRLALVTLLQFAEGLSDRQAADAVRARVDWKYLLGLELTDPGFHYSVLTAFRERLLQHQASVRLLEVLLTHARSPGLLSARGRQRTDATHVLATVRRLNRLEAVGETLRHTLHVLAVVAPDWLRTWCPAAWAEPYGRAFEAARLPPSEAARLPPSEAARTALARRIGRDGDTLLAAVDAPEAPSYLRELPAVRTLRRMWLPQYTWRSGTVGELECHWRTDAELPPTPLRLISPYDPEARYGKKRQTSWLGYKVHLTETCAPEQPLLITDVQTTHALEVDSATVPAIQADLHARGLLPDQQLVDTGYVDAQSLARSRADYGVELLGPAPPATSGQAQAGTGFAVADFEVRWEERRAICPAGVPSVQWGEKQQRGQPVIQVQFARETCTVCPHRADCTRSAAGRRLNLRPEAAQAALQAARARQETPAFRATYGPRAGVEGTQSQGVRRCGLRRSRYVGRAKTHLQHIATAAALNLVRLGEWFRHTPRAQTRTSAFARIMAAAV